MPDPTFCEYVWNVLDSYVADHAPGGVAGQDPAMDLTNLAFDHYIAHYGVPATANEARSMFEWAAALEYTWGILANMSTPD